MQLVLDVEKTRKEDAPASQNSFDFYVFDTNTGVTDVIRKEVKHTVFSHVMDAQKAKQTLDELVADQKYTDAGIDFEAKPLARRENSPAVIKAVLENPNARELLPKGFHVKKRKKYLLKTVPYSYERAQNGLEYFRQRFEGENIDFEIIQEDGLYRILAKTEGKHIKQLDKTADGKEHQFFLKYSADKQVSRTKLDETFQHFRRVIQRNPEITVKPIIVKKKSRDKKQPAVLRFHSTKTGIEQLRKAGHIPKDAEVTIRPETDKTDPMNIDSQLRFVKQTYPPLTLANALSAKSSEDLWKQHAKPSLDDLLSQNVAVMDIESEYNEETEKYDKVYAITYKSKNKRVYATLFDPKKPRINNYDVHTFASSEELVAFISELEKQDNPLFVIGHNIMGYDLQTLKGYTGYKPSVNHKAPKTEMKKRHTRTVTPGRFGIDTLPFSLIYGLTLFKNNKLATLNRAFGGSFVKGESYKALEELVKLCQNPAKSEEEKRIAANRLAEYATTDVEETEYLGLKVLPIITLIALATNSTPSQVCTTHPLTVINDYRKQMYLTHLGVPIQKRYATEPTVEEKITELLMLDNHHAKSGNYSDVTCIQLTPCIKAFEEMFQTTHVGDHLPHIYERFLAGETLERVIITQFLNAYINEPLESVQGFMRKVGSDLCKRTMTPEEVYPGLDVLATNKLFQLNQSDWIFGTAYGVSHVIDMGSHPQESVNYNQLYFNNELTRIIDELKGLITQAGYLNHKKNILFVQDKEVAKKIAEKGYGFIIGQGNALSIGQGRIIARAGFNEDIYLGYGSKRRTKEEKENDTPDLAGRVFEEIKDLALSGASVKEMITHYTNAIKQHGISRQAFEQKYHTELNATLKKTTAQKTTEQLGFNF